MKADHTAPRSFRIEGRSIGPEHPPFVVAEMSGNHNQSLDRALEIVDAAAAAGAAALKIQTYKPETMTIDLREREFVIEDPKSLWAGRSLFDLYQEAHLPWEWHAPIFRRCRERGLIVFSTPFDETAVDFLESLDAPAYKIASFENTDLPLLRRVAATGKPLLVSTGLASVAEIDDCVRAVRGAGGRDLVLLKCTSTYPASPENTNLMTVPHLRDLFDVQVGLSDHTMGIGAAVAAVALGATVVEKHFTLRRTDGGVDSTFSLEPHELAALVTETERAWRALGRVQYGPTTSEQPSLRFRRSLYIVANLKAGERLTSQNVRAIRPGLGLSPKHLEEVLGRELRCDAPRGTALRWDLLK